MTESINNVNTTGKVNYPIGGKKEVQKDAAVLESRSVAFPKQQSELANGATTIAQLNQLQISQTQSTRVKLDPEVEDFAKAMNVPINQSYAYLNKDTAQALSSVTNNIEGLATKSNTTSFMKKLTPILDEFFG